MTQNFMIMKLTNSDDVTQAKTRDQFLELCNGPWRITPHKVGNITTAYILHQGQIIAECEVGDEIRYSRQSGTSTFDLKLVENSTEVGKLLKSSTSNKCYTISQSKFDAHLSDNIIRF